MMLLITPTMGSAPDNSPPNPEAIGPQMLPSSPAPAGNAFPSQPAAPPAIAVVPRAKPCTGAELMTAPPILPIACTGVEWTTLPASPDAFPAIQPPALDSPLPTMPGTFASPVACAIPDRICPLTPTVPRAAPAMPVWLRKFPVEEPMPPKYRPIPLLLIVFPAVADHAVFRKSSFPVLPTIPMFSSVAPLSISSQPATLSIFPRTALGAPRPLFHSPASPPVRTA